MDSGTFKRKQHDMSKDFKLLRDSKLKLSSLSVLSLKSRDCKFVSLEVKDLVHGVSLTGSLGKSEAFLMLCKLQ